MKPKRTYPDQPTGHLITQQDIIKNYKKGKQSVINHLALLYAQGIPAIYSTMPRAKMLLLLNICMVKQWQDNQPVGKQRNWAEYQEYALRQFDRCRQVANRIITGARIANNPTVKARSTCPKVAFYTPLEVFKDCLTPETIQDMQSTLEPHFKAVLDTALNYEAEPDCLELQEKVFNQSKDEDSECTTCLLSTNVCDGCEHQ